MAEGLLRWVVHPQSERTVCGSKSVVPRSSSGTRYCIPAAMTRLTIALGMAWSYCTMASNTTPIVTGDPLEWFARGLRRLSGDTSPALSASLSASSATK